MTTVNELLMTSPLLSFNFYAKEKVMFSKAQTRYEERMRYWRKRRSLSKTQGCVGLFRIKRDCRKLPRLFSCFSTTILKFLGIVVSTYNYRFGGRNGPRGAGVWGKYGVRNK